MPTRFERISPVSGLLAVGFWIGGFVVAQVADSPPADSATDAQVLAWVHAHSDAITAGGWLFMIGCGCFIWFAGTLRSRLASAEGGTAALSTLVLAGGAAAGVLAMGMPAGDLSAAIAGNDLHAGSAGALHQLGTVFFVLAELTAAVLQAAAGFAILRTRALPRAWGYVSLALAVLLLVGPIGWLGLIVGMPLWTLVTTILVLRPQRGNVPARTAAVPA